MASVSSLASINVSVSTNLDDRVSDYAKLLCIFADRHRWMMLVEYVQSSPNGFKVRTHNIIEPLVSNKKLVERRKANNGFKILFLQILGSYPDAEMEKVFLQGVFFVLQKAEDFAGLAVEVSACPGHVSEIRNKIFACEWYLRIRKVFLQHQALFSTLREVYSKSELSELDAGNGLYNKALTAG